MKWLVPLALAAGVAGVIIYTNKKKETTSRNVRGSARVPAMYDPNDIRSRSPGQPTYRPGTFTRTVTFG